MAEKELEKMLFVKSAVKDLIKENGGKTSSDLIENKDGGGVPLNDAIRDIIVRACERCKENGRSTVYPRDL